MQDSTQEVFAALEAALSVEVFIVVPDDEAKLPAVSFFRASDDVLPAADDEYATTERFVIDVWGVRYSDIAPHMQAVNATMASLGFDRAGSFLTPLDDTGAMHQNMQYERTI